MNCSAHQSATGLATGFVRFACLPTVVRLLGMIIIIFVGSSLRQLTAQTVEFTQNSSGGNSMVLQVPLGNYPGRGGSFPVRLDYSSKSAWRIGYIKSIHANVWGYPILRAATEAIYAEHSTAGWTTSLDVPVVEWPRQNDVFWFTGKPYRGTVYPYTFRVARVFIHMPDGSSHELRKADQVYQDTGTIDMSGTFYAVDESRMRYDSTGQTTGTLYMPDGTRYVLDGINAQYIDRNGNTLNYDGTNRQWTDTMGRVFSLPWPVNPGAGDYPYALPGLGGASINYTLKFRNLSDVLSPGSPAQKAMADYYLPNPYAPPTDEGGSNFPQSTGGAPSLFYSDYADESETSYSYVVGRGQAGAGIFNPVVLSEIVLPTGQSYRFTYNIYGEIDKVIYPTGGYQRYDYNTVPGIGQGAGSIPYSEGNRGIVSRWVSPNGTGGSDESQWIYESSLYYGYVIKVTAPDGSRTETVLHSDNGGTNNFGYSPVWNGLPFEERVYAPPSQGGVMLRRMLIEHAMSSITFNRPTIPNNSNPGTYTAYRNPREQKSVKILLDTGGAALVSGSTSQYDLTYQFSVGPDRTQVADYSFTTTDQNTAQTGVIANMPFGTPVRATETTYLTYDANYRNRNILGLVSSSLVRDLSSNAVMSQTAFAYDEPAYPPLLYGFVTGWTDPQTSYRGNMTTTSQWLDYPASTWLSTHAQYDQCGSVRYAWDAKGNLAQTNYSSSFAYAYPTQTIGPVPDSTGAFGSTTSLVTSSDYDFNTGLVNSTTDANGKTTTFEYNDPLNRVRKVNRPDGGWTTTEYGDAPGNIYVRTQIVQHTSPSLVTLDAYKFLDKLGRTVRSFAKEDSSYVVVDTQYDVMGRAWRVSNPYRTNSIGDPINPSGIWINNTYDALGRVTAVTTPDSAQVITAYGASLTPNFLGPTVTSTDPAGKSRTSISDAQGRVIQVIEDPAGVAYQTNYTYDTLNNLRKVEQGAQLRYFGYDSLSRVIRVRSVEQAINSALNWTDPVNGYAGGWNKGISYDNNGNVTTRVDSRNVTTTYTYDTLNRVTTVRYTDGTKDIDRHYDGAINGRGRFWYSNWDPNNNTRFDTHLAIDEYDNMGRAKNYRQHFLTNGVAGAQFNVTRTYDLAGSVVSQTYPSGHTVNYTYDTAGRTSSYTGTLGDGVTRTYSSGITYSEFGGIKQEQFGTQTALYNKLHYNFRGQLYDTRLSTYSLTANEWDWNRGALVSYFSSNYSWGGNSSGSGPDNNGNITLQQHWVPTDEAYSTYSYSQDFYSYDSLNRLSWTSEVHGGQWGQSGQDFKQAYAYDRFGNRTIDQAQTTTNVPHPNYTVDANTNQLTAPSGYNYSYDANGNQTNDNYTGEGSRTYDAENHLKQAWANNQWQTYTYDADGRRIKRLVNGSETWQVYGIGGELLAEYKPGAAPFLPAVEYGYRGGQLLVTMSSNDDSRLSRFVTNLYYGALQRDPTSQELQDKVNQLGAAGAQSQAQLLTTAKDIARSLFTQTGYETSPYRSDIQYVADLYYTYLQRGPDDGGLNFWAGQVSSNGRAAVCNAFEGSSEFAGLVSTLYGAATSEDERTERLINNYYLGAYGRTPTSTEMQQQKDAINAAAAQGLTQVQSQVETMGRALFAAQVSDYSITDQQFVTNLYEAFLQRGPDAGGLAFWTSNAAGGSQNRQNVLNAFAPSSGARALAGALYREGFWLVADRLGTPRIIVNKSGSLASVKRHDYLPFGEELYAGMGGRTSAQGYTGDSVRQHFTGYENDAETGLNYAQARYQSSAQGRFTSVDPLGASAAVPNPQSFNRYSYVLNNPANSTDPTGLMGQMPDASTSWSDVADGFWGTSLISGGPPAPAGQQVIAEAMARHDRWVDIDRAGGEYGDDDYPQAPPTPSENTSGDGGTTAVHEAGHSTESTTTATATVALTDSAMAVPQAGGGAAQGQGRGRGRGRNQNQQQAVDGPGAGATPVSATGGRNNTVVVTYSDGTIETRAGGSRAWRNNNPGNIRPGNLTGEIGSAGGFAVFSSEAAGQAAISELLSRPAYQRLTVSGAIARWAPPNENNTAAYQGWVQQVTGLPGNTQMTTLNAGQLQNMATAIRGIEGWTAGRLSYTRPVQR
ncbi:MAG: repeat-associated core domain protein [Acidobacteria bacterium]|nr:repeat-associated core domain protein [Acidobacteriota bacterium]